eukprot:XP_001702339.1 3',5'-cyclic-nucleotide phosphodiesterase [Chlamydomonas reinhardtii]
MKAGLGNADGTSCPLCPLKVPSLDAPAIEVFNHYCSPRHSRGGSGNVASPARPRRGSVDLPSGAQGVSDDPLTPASPWWAHIPPHSDGDLSTRSAPLGGIAGDVLSPRQSNCYGPATPGGAGGSGAGPGARSRLAMGGGRHMQARRLSRSKAGTPADLLLSMLSNMLLGLTPDLRDVELARTMLLRHADPYQPLNLDTQMREANLDVERALALADEWKYDTWHLAEVTKGHALSCLGFYLLHREGLISQFRIKPTKLLRSIEAGYADNPYHNSTHAADVLQTFHVLMRGAGLTTHYLDRVGLLAAYFAAMVHDHGHPGLTADFLIATSDPLAVRYNDRSPLENHHGASFFSMLMQSDMNVLAQLTQHEKNAFRKQVLDLVMATDMKQHFTLLSHFNTAHHLPAYNKEAGPWALVAEPAPTTNQSGTEQASGGAARGAEGDIDGAEAAVSFTLLGTFDPTPLDDTERTLTLQVALKAADLGHLGEELEVHKRWVRALEEEFFRQGDQELARGLPISPLFDRAKQGVSKSQVGFYDFIALPLVHALASAFPGARPLLACYVANYDHWREAEKAAAAAAAAVAASAAAGRVFRA